MNNIINIDNSLESQSIDLDLVKQIFANMDVSENTLKEYMQRIPKFLEFVQINGLSANTLLDFKRELDQFQIQNSKGEWKAAKVSTKNKYFLVAKVLLKQLKGLGQIPKQVNTNVKLFKQKRGHKKDGLTKSEVMQVVRYVSSLDKDSLANLQIRAITSLLIFQGLRLIEIVRLDAGDINYKSCTATVLGKGADEKELIHLHANVCKMLKEYMQATGIETGPLFINVKTRRAKSRVSTRYIQRIYEKIFKELGIEKSTHGFRHHFTTNLLNEYSGDLRKVRKYTRHSSFDMLIIYDDELQLEKDLPNFRRAFNDFEIE